MTLEIRKNGALMESFKPGYYGCDCCRKPGCNCPDTGDTPTPDTGDTGITAITIIVADSITDTGRARASFTPSTASTLLYFSSSDSSIATIDSDTGQITVLQDGVVTFCVEDLYTGLEDCKEVDVYKSVTPVPTGDTGITSITIIVADTITDTGVATCVFEPASADTEIVYSSSDESIALIDPETGEIEVLETGFVTFCVEDLLSGLENCKTVSVVKSEAPGSYRLKLVFDVTSTTEYTIVMNRHSNVISAELEDGTVIPLGTKKYVQYKFPRTGRNIVYLTLDSGELIGYMFSAFDSFERTAERLIEVEIGEDITSVMNHCFTYCSILSSITMTDSINYIGDRAFRLTNLRNVVIPGTVTLAWGAFMDCKNLQNVTFGAEIGNVDDDDNQTQRDNDWSGVFWRCTSLSAFYGPNASSDHRMLIKNGMGIAFAPAGLFSYTIPNTVSNIRYGCFAYTSLTGITIQNSVVKIGARAFDSCESLQNITIPTSVTFIGIEAFYKCISFTSIEIPSGVTTIGARMCYYCSNIHTAIFRPSTPPSKFVGGSGTVLIGAPGTYYNDVQIYTPEQSVTAYRTYWYDEQPWYLSRIQAENIQAIQ